MNKSESESHPVLFDSLQLHGQYRPWNCLGQNTGVVTYPFSRESSQSRDRTGVSWIAGGFFTNWASREALLSLASVSSKSMAEKFWTGGFIFLKKLLIVCISFPGINHIFTFLSPILFSSALPLCQSLELFTNPVAPTCRQTVALFIPPPLRASVTMWLVLANEI